MKNIFLKLPLLLTITFTVVFFTACEEEFIPEISTDPEDIVVEGFIEGGEQPTPPYVILTKSLPFFSEINNDEFNNLFVHDAIVTVTEGSNTATLSEICLDALTPEQQILVGSLFGIDTDSIAVNFCVYIDLGFSMMGAIGKSYDLKIEVENKTITARTTIPEHVPLDSLTFVKPAGEVSDGLREMLCYIQDDPDLTSYYRYFTQVDDGPLTPGFNSVFDDLFFNGQAFDFPLSKGEPRTAEFDPETFGLYNVGETATLKWCNIDDEHYRFWETLEFNASNQGPFSNYTRVDSNVEGGLGIWGGYSVSSYTAPVE